MVSIVYDRVHSTFITLWCSTSLRIKLDQKQWHGRYLKTWCCLQNFTDLHQTVLKFNMTLIFGVNKANDVQNNSLCQKITSSQKL